MGGYGHAPGCGQEHNDRLLGAYRGILQCDGYATCKKLAGPNDEGGADWAHVASLVKACKLNGVNPQACLTDLLTRPVHGWPQARIDELMPRCGPPKGTADRQPAKIRVAEHRLRHDDFERRLMQAPSISVPTIAMEGDAHAEASAYAKQFTR